LSPDRKSNEFSNLGRSVDRKVDPMEVPLGQGGERKKPSFGDLLQDEYPNPDVSVSDPNINQL